MVRTKICGITNYRDAEAALRYGADAIGFIFAESPRRISPAAAKVIIRKLPPYITTVGVFVNENKNEILKIVGKCRIDCIQLHGEESPAYCKELSKYYKIVKAIRVSGPEIFKMIKEYDVDGLLLDAYVKGKRGGTGIKFDWALAAAAKKIGIPLILSGGLDIDNVEKAIRKVRPYAIDVSSGIELSPGRKNHSLMKKFIERVRKINN